MCRMVGVVFRRAFPYGMLEDLRFVAENGKVPDQGDEIDGHRDGWGMVSFSNGSPFYVGRSSRPVHIDPSFEAAAANIGSLERPNILMCHARRGSEGGPSLQNTHPFIYRNVTFAHNGSVKEYHPTTSYTPRGKTDSERVFAAFVDRYEDAGEIESALTALLKDVISDHDYTGLVFLISDGANLYGYREHGEGKDGEYYNLKYIACDDYVALYQESPCPEDDCVVQVDKGSLVRVSLDLEVQTKRLF